MGTLKLSRTVSIIMASRELFINPKMYIQFSSHKCELFIMHFFSFFCERAAICHSLKLEFAKKLTALLGGEQTLTTKSASAAHSIREKWEFSSLSLLSNDSEVK